MDTQEHQATTTAPAGDAPARKRPRGMGFCYQRGETWWVCYWHNGRRVRESTKSTQESAAIRLLKQRHSEIHQGAADPAAEARVTMRELFDLLKIDYQNNGRRSARTLGVRLVQLREAFGSTKASAVTGERIERYKRDRLAAGRQPATVNRELAALRRAFKLALALGTLSRIPVVTLLAEDNARQGFVNPADFESIVKHLPEYLQDVARFGYATGWRKGEILTLTWADIDRERGTVTLRREHSKSKRPRVIPLATDELRGIIDRRWEARQFTPRRGLPTLSAFVFHRRGRAIKDFRVCYRHACEAAGFPYGRAAGITFHDNRRSAVRNMDKAGVTESVAMSITGHETNSVYKRYRIVDEGDIAAALAKTEAANRADTAAGPVVVPLRRQASAG